MRKFISLTSIQLKDFFSRYGQQLNVKNKWLSKLIVFLPLLIFLPAIQIVRQLYDLFFTMGYPELILTYLYVGATMFIFFTGIPLIISVFFYAKDLSLIATLPVKEDTIVFSKLASVYVYMLVISTALFGTGVGFYAFSNGFKPLSLLLGIIAVLLTPLMPMIFATLVIMPFMSFVGARKKRNMMVIIGNLLLLAVIIGMQMVFTRIQLNPEELQQYFLRDDGLIALVGYRFPPSLWLTKMIMGSGIDLLLYFCLNAAFVIGLKVLAKRLYHGALLKYNQQAGKITNNGPIEYNSSSKRVLLVKRHLGIIFNNPTFLLNTVLTLFIPILLFIIYAATGILSLETFKDPSLAPYTLYIFAGVISMPTVVGSLSATVITREGKTFWETRVLPISAKENIQTRILSTIFLNGVATIVLGLIMVWILPINTFDILLGFVLAFVAILCFSTLDIIINIERPYLNWSNPTAAVKNNLNLLLALIPRIVVAGIGFLSLKLLDGVGPEFMVLIWTLMLFIGFIVVNALVFGRYTEKFINMDI